MPERVILFDGICNLCSSWVRFVVKRDPKKRFHFAPLQSSLGQRILGEIGLPREELRTVILVEGKECYFKSTATLQIVRRLSGLWPILFIFIVVPTPLRDFLYGIVARNRYRWFGKRGACFVPTPDIRERFLE